MLEHQEGGHLRGPPRRDLMADAPLKLIGAGKSCLLPATSGEILRVPQVRGVGGAGVIPRWFDSFFWGMVWGRRRDERGALPPGMPVPPRPSWEIKILGFGEGGISLQGLFVFFQITDYHRLSPL